MRLLSAFALMLSASSAHALCSGADFIDRLSPAQVAQIESDANTDPFGRGLIWNATRGEDSLTIVGTMHIYDDRLLPIFETIRNDVANADLILLEATPKEEAELQQAFASNPDLIFITDGPTLPEQLDEETWAALSQAARERQLPPFMAAKMQPWYLSLTLAIPPCAMADLAMGLRGLDHMIIDAAEVADVPMQALEPYTTLIDVMRSSTPEEQLEMLEMALMEPTIQSELFIMTLNSYFAQNTAAIWETSILAIDYFPDIDQDNARAMIDETEQALLIDRNTKWIPVIETAMTTHDTAVVAVGAAHLPSETGILNLLQNEGWTISKP